MKNKEKSNKYQNAILNGNKFKISIIIPVYNAENYINDALESVIMQTIGLENLEVIMVDDCSTDESGKIIDKYANKYKNFIAIHLSENSGFPGKPRNIGMQRANGDYLMFFDSDDIFVKDICEILYNRITAENTDIVFCRFMDLYENSVQKHLYVFEDMNEINVKTIEEEKRLLMTPPSIWTKIFKKSFIEKKDILFPEDVIAEDLTFMIHAFLKANGIIFLNRYYGYYYRIRDRKESSNLFTKKYLNAMIRGYSETFNILKYYKKEEYFPFIFRGHLQFWLNGFISSTASSSEKKELLKEIHFLFKELEKYGLQPVREHLIPLFDNIADKKYDSAILISDELNNF
ncbi:glycosyltransferase family 2 protein [Methanobacterium sp. MBAC-LM]|uniref:glycosyltransferase family 2 protein n=1 Tax=Methanobacterium sp. MBAC-LM TaxID=3412034 RepID=UPI003C739913